MPTTTHNAVFLNLRLPLFRTKYPPLSSEPDTIIPGCCSMSFLVAVSQKAKESFSWPRAMALKLAQAAHLQWKNLHDSVKFIQRNRDKALFIDCDM